MTGQPLPSDTAEHFLVERELKDTDLDALFHARLIDLCKAGLPRMELVTRENAGLPKQAQKG